MSVHGVEIPPAIAVQQIGPNFELRVGESGLRTQFHQGTSEANKVNIIQQMVDFLMRKEASK